VTTTGAAEDCLFCRIVAGQVPADVVRTDDRTVAFRDINPAAPVHVLVVPRRHLVNAGTVVTEDAEDLAAMVVAARAVADAEGIGGDDRGYRLVFNVGPDALNSVPHLHLHVLGGRTFDWPPG
jgi:histidine triad (HIT) family protein